MVSVTTHPPKLIDSAHGIDFNAWIERLPVDYASDQRQVILDACALAEKSHHGQARVSGEPYIYHSLAAAYTLAELHLDYETLAAAILHDVVEDTSVTIDDLQQQFGVTIATLVDGVTRMDNIHDFQLVSERRSKERVQSENLRKMLLAMAEDVRVVLIKLADRLHNMRTLNFLSVSKQRRIANETMEIYAPLANRLGIWQIKWELEDLAFRYLHPLDYHKIAVSLAEKRTDRENYIKRFVNTLQNALDSAGVPAEISGRAKHIYGIWKKMQKKHQAFHQIYDTRAVRVLVDTIPQCYEVLGIVHTQWHYLSGEFDDYIATPKKNGYRSIHTAVRGPQGKIVEVQIRTHEMHQTSELGVAAHWRYKENKYEDTDFDNKIAWLRQLLEWKDEVAEAGEFVDQFKSEMFADRVYVFTPKGKIVDLPQGSTPLDFAYHIHTEVGHRCRGARVNGRIVPLDYELKTGEWVEALTIKQGGPSRDWLNPHLKYLKTSKARSCVKHWFRQQNYESNVADGRATLERELKRLGYNDVNLERLALHLDYSGVDDFHAAIGRGDIKMSRYLAALQKLYEKPHETSMDPAAQRRIKTSELPVETIRVRGVGGMLTRLAKCCKPLPGDSIVGFITRGQGVTIHRRDCHIALRNSSENPDRLVDVDWGENIPGAYPVDVRIEAYDRQGLLRDITTILANEKINVLAVNSLSNTDDSTTSMVINMEIPDIDTLSRVLLRIDQIPNVIEVKRKIH